MAAGTNPAEQLPTVTANGHAAESGCSDLVALEKRSLPVETAASAVHCQ